MTFKQSLLIPLFCIAAIAAPAQSTTDTLTVYFRQGKAVVDPSFMGNDTVAAKIKTILQLPLSAIKVHGAASPEGPAGVNQRLSRRRATAVARYFNLPDSIVSTSSTAADWEGLRTRVLADPNVPFKTEVESVTSDIVTATDKACAIDVLRNMHRSRPYVYIYKNHFPYLRRAEVVFERVGTDTVATEILADPTPAIQADTIPEAENTKEATPGGLSAATVGAPTHGYIFGLKTNMLYDAALIPNIGMEFPIGPRFSAGADWMYAWWKNHTRNRHWRIYGGDVFARYWFKQGARNLNGHHLGLYGTVLLYQVAFGGKGYISGIPGQNMTGGKPWFGGGVEYGYSLNVHPRLNIDFSLGVGYAGGEQRDYRMIDGCYVWQSSSRKHWFGPTKAEISLVWKIGRLSQTAKKGKEAAK